MPEVAETTGIASESSPSCASAASSILSSSFIYYSFAAFFTNTNAFGFKAAPQCTKGGEKTQKDGYLESLYNFLGGHDQWNSFGTINEY